MTPQVAVPLRAAGFTSAARCLAAWWSRPEPAQVEEWAAAWPLAEEAVEVVRTGRAELAELDVALAAADVEELLDEYERLLVGPGRAPCGPYESLWRGDVSRREQGSLMGPAATDVVRVYRDLGLAVRTDAHELPDHLAIEWEALAYAFDHDELQAAAELARGHLAVWMPAFTEAVAAETKMGFYSVLARLTASWTAAIAA